jgi:IS5 family transposase
VVGTAANEADINQMAAVLHGEERAVFADAGYTGADKRPEHEGREVSWNIAIKRGIIKALPKGLRDLAEPVERALAQVRAWSLPSRKWGSSIPSMWSRTPACAGAGSVPP